MNTNEFTLLKCFSEGSRIIKTTSEFRQIPTEINDQDLIKLLMQIKDESKKGGRVNKPDYLIPIEGKNEIYLSLNDFQKALSSNEDLADEKLTRYFPDIKKSEKRKKTDTTSQRNTRYKYFKSWADAYRHNELSGITLLVKNHISEAFMTIELVIDTTTAAESVLQYMLDNEPAYLQPVAAFSGSVKIIGTDTEDYLPVSDPAIIVLGVLIEDYLVKNGYLKKFENASDPERGLEWLASVLKKKAVVAIESDFSFCEQAIAHHIQDIADLPNVILQPDASPDLYLTFAPPSRPSLVVISLSAYKRILDTEKLVYEIQSRNHAVLVGCNNLRSLPEQLRRITEITIKLPRIDRNIFEKLFSVLFNGHINDEIFEDDDDSWMQYIQAWDIAKTAKFEKIASRAFQIIKHRVLERLKRLTPIHGPSLSQLHGLGEAKIRAEMLIADIREAVSGNIPWSQVDRGMLLAGPPGCGKTALARAIAKDCGIRFVESSAARWQMAGALNDHLSAMSADFAEARRFEPSIMFIDEIDSIGNREHFSGQNASYHTQVVNALLAELQGFSERGKVILIAATNLVENVDPALRRAGRLDRIIKVNLPTIDALEKIFEYYLINHGWKNDTNSDIVLRPIAEAAFGRSGADVSLAVRGAVRRARTAGRPLCQDDLLAELYERPLDKDISRPLSGEGIKRVAVHEAGHAVMRLKSGRNLGKVGFISIVPRTDGSLGFVAMQPNPDVSTVCRADFLAMIDVALAGRAAEEVFYGIDGVGAGAGGGEYSDLAKATSIALDMVCRLGLGLSQKPRWRHEHWDADLLEADDIVSESYNRTLRLITKHKKLVEKIADLLVDRQEISGADLMAAVGYE